MNLALDLNTFLTLSAVGGLGYAAKTMLKTVVQLDRIDERTIQHEKRIESLEDRVA